MNADSLLIFYEKNSITVGKKIIIVM